MPFICCIYDTPPVAPFWHAIEASARGDPGDQRGTLDFGSGGSKSRTAWEAASGHINAGIYIELQGSRKSSACFMHWQFE